MQADDIKTCGGILFLYKFAARQNSCDEGEALQF